MAQIFHATQQNYQQLILKADLPVLVEFWAPWCGPSFVMGNDLETLSATWPDQIQIVRLNVDEEHALAMRFKITSVPTIMIFQNGLLIERVAGAMPHRALESIIRRNLARKEAA